MFHFYGIQDSVLHTIMSIVSACMTMCYKRVLLSESFLADFSIRTNTFTYPYTAPMRTNKPTTATTNKTIIIMSLDWFDSFGWMAAHKEYSCIYNNNYAAYPTNNTK